jgi:hypothetical protein
MRQCHLLVKVPSRWRCGFWPGRLRAREAKVVWGVIVGWWGSKGRPKAESWCWPARLDVGWWGSKGRWRKVGRWWATARHVRWAVHGENMVVGSSAVHIHMAKVEMLQVPSITGSGN